MKNVVLVFLITISFIGCNEREDYLPTNFAYEITPIEITEDVNVGAYYYNISEEYWSENYSYTPVLGEYNSLDSNIMAQHRNWADLGGIDFFIFNWNGNEEDEELISRFINGRSNEVRMVINYSTSHLGTSNSSPLEGEKLSTMISEFEAIASTHFEKDYYFKINGQPVVLFSPLNLSSSRSESIDFNLVVPQLKSALSEIGISLYIIGEITSGWLPPQRHSEAIQTVDAVTLKDWATSNYDRSFFFPSYIDQNWKNWTDSTSVWGVDFTPVIFPGYDDKEFNSSSSLYNMGQNSEFLIDLSNVAKGRMSDERIVIFNSWNDFQLGNTIEPTEEYGTTYLEILKEQFKTN
jgi:hypothetical protein